MSLSSIRKSASSTPERSDAVQEERLRILIVDDMKTIRAYNRSIFKDGNYVIEEATNGVEALARAKVIHPHLVLMDIEMPEMDGIACCRELKRDASLKNVKVMMVTGKGEYRQIAEAFRAGCDDYITKPIEKQELLEKVEELSRYVRARNKLRPFLDQDKTPRSPTGGNHDR